MARNRFATRTDLRIAYETRGRWWLNRQWLVLIMGLGFDREGWTPILKGLQRHFRLVLIDNRGCGRSSVPARPFTVADLAADVIAVLDDARIEQANVFGISLGGMVAQRVAIDYPRRVQRLILGCTTPGWPIAHPMPAPALRLLASSSHQSREVLVRRTVENALSPTTLEQRPELVDSLIEHQRHRPTSPAAWSALAAAGAGYFSSPDRLPIHAPTLVLHGDADTVVDPRNATLLARRIKDAELVRIPGAGHLFFWEQPELVVREIRRFLRS